MNLSKKSKVLLLIVTLFIIGIYSIFTYAYKPHKTIDDIPIAYSGTSENFIEKVKINTLHWQDVVVELSGIITSKDESGITLNNSVYCQLEDGIKTTDLQEGQSISIKGRVIGYDDLLEEIKLDQTIIK